VALIGHVVFLIVPAGGTSAANCYQREIRHVLALRAALGQAKRLACAVNVHRLRTTRQPQQDSCRTISRIDVQDLLQLLTAAVVDDSRLSNGCAWNAVSAFANCGHAVAFVQGRYGLVRWNGLALPWWPRRSRPARSISLPGA
jgi:hypothetical protein